MPSFTTTSPTVSPEQGDHQQQQQQQQQDGSLAPTTSIESSSRRSRSRSHSQTRTYSHDQPPQAQNNTEPASHAQERFSSERRHTSQDDQQRQPSTSPSLLPSLSSSQQQPYSSSPSSSLLLGTSTAHDTSNNSVAAVVGSSIAQHIIPHSSMLTTSYVVVDPATSAAGAATPVANLPSSASSSSFLQRPSSQQISQSVIPSSSSSSSSSATHHPLVVTSQLVQSTLSHPSPSRQTQQQQHLPHFSNPCNHSLVSNSGSPSSTASRPANEYAYQIAIDVPRDAVGFIIGKHGETVRNMMKRSSAFIYVDRGDTNPNAPVRLFHIAGSRNAVTFAHDLIKEKVYAVLHGKSNIPTFRTVSVDFNPSASEDPADSCPLTLTDFQIDDEDDDDDQYDQGDDDDDDDHDDDHDNNEDNNETERNGDDNNNNNNKNNNNNNNHDDDSKDGEGSSTRRVDVRRPRRTGRRMRGHSPRALEMWIPRGCVGMIIGQGGQAIYDMQESSGTTIVVHNHVMDKNGSKLLTIYGGEREKNAARDLIQDVLDRAGTRSRPQIQQQQPQQQPQHSQHTRDRNPLSSASASRNTRSHVQHQHQHQHQHQQQQQQHHHHHHQQQQQQQHLQLQQQHHPQPQHPLSPSLIPQQPVTPRVQTVFTMPQMRHGPPGQQHWSFLMPQMVDFHPLPSPTIPHQLGPPWIPTPPQQIPLNQQQLAPNFPHGQPSAGNQPQPYLPPGQPPTFPPQQHLQPLPFPMADQSQPLQQPQHGSQPRTPTTNHQTPGFIPQMQPQHPTLHDSGRGYPILQQPPSPMIFPPTAWPHPQFTSRGVPLYSDSQSHASIGSPTTQSPSQTPVQDSLQAPSMPPATSHDLVHGHVYPESPLEHLPYDPQVPPAETPDSTTPLQLPPQVVPQSQSSDQHH